MIFALTRMRIFYEEIFFGLSSFFEKAGVGQENILLKVVCVFNIFCFAVIADLILVFSSYLDFLKAVPGEEYNIYFVFFFLFVLFFHYYFLNENELNKRIISKFESLTDIERHRLRKKAIFICISPFLIMLLHVFMRLTISVISGQE
jgi:hypothetical protein